MSSQSHNTNNTSQISHSSLEIIYIDFYLLSDFELNSLKHREYVERLSQYQIPFELARKLDNKFYDMMGTYWLKAYNFPKVGDVLSNGRTVTAVGFLTFQLDDDEEESYDSYDETDPRYAEDCEDFSDRISRIY